MPQDVRVSPWDDVRGLVDAFPWVMGDNEVLHPRGIHLQIENGEVSSEEVGQLAGLPCSPL